jgi:AraC-like DNA-binding protein
MDRLAHFFSRFSLAARVFFAGHLCGTSHDHLAETGHLHVLRNGVLHISEEDGRHTIISEPTVLLYPRPGAHRFQSKGADIVCAYVDFGVGMLDPLRSALPGYLAVPLSSIPELVPTVELLFTEAFEQREGRQVAVDRLTEYFLVLLLRSALNANLIRGGILNALSDDHLSNAVAAIHEAPERDWTLAEFAHLAGMSRARFAAHFLATVGQTPFTYLAHCRIGVAQTLLKRGEPLKSIAPAVGYANTGALIRSFSQHVGMPPMTWLAAQQGKEAASKSRAT